MKNPINTKETRYQYAARMVGELAPLLPLPTVYDIGAGLGQLREPVQQTGLEYVGFDYQPQTKGMVVWNLDEKCPLDRPAAGLVLLLEVVEHLLNPGVAFDSIAGLIAPGGYFLVTTPNPQWSRSRLEALRTGYPSFFTITDLELNGHVFPVFPHVLEHMLKQRGFVIEQFVMLKAPTVWPKLQLRPWYPFRLVHAAANKLIEKLDKTATGGCYAVLAKKTAAI